MTAPLPRFLALLLVVSAPAFPLVAASDAEPGPAAESPLDAVAPSGTIQQRILAAADALGWAAPAPSVRLPSLSVEDALLCLYGAAGIDIDEDVQELVEESAEALNSAVARPLSRLVTAACFATADQVAAFATVPVDTWTAFVEWLVQPESQVGKAQLPEEIAASIAENMDSSLVLRAALTMQDARARAVPSLVKASVEGKWPGGSAGASASASSPSPVAWQDPLGLVALGTLGDDTYAPTFGKWILVDPAGDDLYMNNAGGAAPLPLITSGAPLVGDGYLCAPHDASTPACTGPVVDTPFAIWSIVSVAIDLGAGNDRYFGDAWRGVASQGGAFGGIAYLEDQGGHNVYWANYTSQGAAQFGIGVLNASGKLATDNDSYNSLSWYTQGAGGVAGIGLLIDWAGDDVHDVQANSLGAAAPSTGVYIPTDMTIGVPGEGAGIFEDRAGVDTYLSGSDTVAGFARDDGYGNRIGIASFRDLGGATDSYSYIDATTPKWGNSQSWTYADLAGGSDA